MSLWRDDQNKDIQLVVEKGEQVLNVSVKIVFFSLSFPEHILKNPLPFSFLFPEVTEIGYNLQNLNIFLQFLLFLITCLLLALKITLNMQCI